MIDVAAHLEELVRAEQVRRREDKAAVRARTALQDLPQEYDRSAARHDHHAELLDAHGAKRAADAERRAARALRDAARVQRRRS